MSNAYGKDQCTEEVAELIIPRDGESVGRCITNETPTHHLHAGNMHLCERQPRSSTATGHRISRRKRNSEGVRMKMKKQRKNVGRTQEVSYPQPSSNREKLPKPRSVVCVNSEEQP